MLGPRGRAGSMVAPSGFGPTAVRQEGRPGRGWTAPSTAWVDRVGNGQGTVDHGPLSLWSHVFGSDKQDLGRFAKRLRAWLFLPKLSCEVAQDTTIPWTPRPAVACLSGRQGRAAEGWSPDWR